MTIARAFAIALAANLNNSGSGKTRRSSSHSPNLQSRACLCSLYGDLVVVKTLALLRRATTRDFVDAYMLEVRYGLSTS